jgi:hypothetical protein
MRQPSFWPAPSCRAHAYVGIAGCGQVVLDAIARLVVFVGQQVLGQGSAAHRGTGAALTHQAGVPIAVRGDGTIENANAAGRRLLSFYPYRCGRFFTFSLARRASFSLRHRTLCAMEFEQPFPEDRSGVRQASITELWPCLLNDVAIINFEN